MISSCIIHTLSDQAQKKKALTTLFRALECGKEAAARKLQAHKPLELSHLKNPTPYWRYSARVDSYRSSRTLMTFGPESVPGRLGPAWVPHGPGNAAGL